jgi:hypothetical protein
MTAEGSNDSESDNSGSPTDEQCIALDQTIEQPADDIFELFGSWRRRETIRFIAEMAENEEIRQGDLATEIAAVENDKAPEEVTSSERKSVLVALYQYHLEKLEATDVATWKDGVVTKDENAAMVARLIEIVETVCTGD